MVQKGRGILVDGFRGVLSSFQIQYNTIKNYKPPFIVASEMLDDDG